MLPYFQKIDRRNFITKSKTPASPSSEIQIAVPGEVDLKKWTADEIIEVIHSSYDAVWKLREVLGIHQVEYLSRFIRKDTYPKQIRATLRDAVTYFWVDLLSDTSLWRPEHSNQVYLLNPEELLADSSDSLKNIELSNPGTHPILKATAILTDLKRWHAKQGNREGELEALLSEVKLIHSNFSK